MPSGNLKSRFPEGIFFDSVPSMALILLVQVQLWYLTLGVRKSTSSKYIGFTFLKYGRECKVRPLAVTIKRVNEIVRGWINYFQIGMNVVNFIISKELLETRIKDSAGLLNPLSYYLSNVGI